MSDDWGFSVAVYGWGTGLEAETAEGDDIDITFKDILENLSFTYMGSVGVNKGKWGFVTDVIYLNVEDSSNHSLNRIFTLSNIELKAWIVTPMVTYNVIHSDRGSLNLLAGARYLNLKAWLKIDPLPKASETADGWAGIVGARGKVNLIHNWYLPFYFDVGTGDMKLTWQAFGGVGYKINRFDLFAGYRYLTWDFDDSDKGGEIFNDLTFSGPMLGAKFRF